MSRTLEEVAEELKAQIDSVEIDMCEASVFKLSDAIREGCSVSEQAYNWGDGDTLCALSAANVSAKARGYC